VLLVDDDTMVRDFLADALADQGFTMLRASGGPAALALLTAGERPDMVVTDYEMPEMDGLSLIDAMRADAALRDLPTILLTGNLEAGLDGRLTERMAADAWLRVLRKPISAEDLAMALRAMDGDAGPVDFESSRRHTAQGLAGGRQ
jgi:CheY-like chemotaxis protein